ncbi:EpsG family protein, partial [Vibrio aestuarianus subsp. cardii]
MNLFFFSLYSIFCFVTIPRSKKIIFLLFMSFGLIYFSGFRYETGIDYFNYLRLYDANYFASTEYLYWLMSIFHKYLFDSFSLFVFMVAVVTISIKIYVLNKLSANIFISMYIFICISYIYVDLGLIRNSISLAFFMLCFFMYVKKQSVIAVCFFIVALLFHHSVIFMLYIFFISNDDNAKVSRKYLYFLFLFICLSYLGIMKEFVASMGAIPGLEYISWKLAFYLDNDAYQNTNLNIYNLRYVIVSLFIFNFRKRIQCGSLIKIYFIGTYLLLLFGFNIQL